MSIKFVLVVLSFFLLTLPFVHASEIKVLYFFGSKCEFSRIEEANMEKLRDYWRGKVEWNDYDLDNSSNIHFELMYGIMGVPAAVIECFNKTIKIDRKDYYFSQEINKTIYECQSENLKTNLFIEKFILLFILGIVIWVHLIRKKLRRKRRKTRKS